MLLAHAADAAWLAGRTADAAALVAEGLSADPAGPARAELLARRGRIGLYGDDQEAAYDTLLEAARLFEDEDPSRAAELLADAIGAGLQVGGASAAEAATRLGALGRERRPGPRAPRRSSAARGDLRGRRAGGTGSARARARRR